LCFHAEFVESNIIKTIKKKRQCNKNMRKNTEKKLALLLLDLKLLIEKIVRDNKVSLKLSS